MNTDEMPTEVESFRKQPMGIWIGSLTHWVALCAFASSALSANPQLKPAEKGPLELAGIVIFPNKNLALLHRSGNPDSTTDFFLSPGQREDGIEVVNIDADRWTVKVKDGGVTTELASGIKIESSPGLTSNANAAVKPAIRFRIRQLPAEQAFLLYQSVSQRTLIHRDQLPDFKLTLRSNGEVTTNEFLDGMERAIAPRGIHFRPEGEKFTFAGTDSDLGKTGPKLHEISEKIASLLKPQTELIPAGFMDFRGIDMVQGFSVFGDLVNRTVITSPRLLRAGVTFKNFGPLTVGEVIYALTAIYALNDVSIACAGENYLLIFPIEDEMTVSRLLAKPKPEPVAADKKALAAGQLDLRGASLQQVVQTYQDLCGRTIDVDKSLTAKPMSLRNQTQLTPAEALYGLDLLLGLRFMEVRPMVYGNSLKLVSYGLH
jgi:hypothetical protein